MKPIVKWAGGKSSLLSKILEEAPKTFNNYIEPFLGGGAVLFGIKPKKALINDLNSELINMYMQIKKAPDELKEQLDLHLENHEKLGDKEYYYSIRNLDRLVGLDNLTDIYRASRFIYLNKSGYNGLYRVNSEGFFNVPLGRRDKLTLYNNDNFTKVSNYLNSNEITMYNEDFYDFVVKHAKKGDFVYLDPPYDIPENGQMFTNYQSNGFGIEEQKKLVKLCKYLHKNGIYFIQSNSETKFIKENYKEFLRFSMSVPTRRLIASKSSSRKQINELLIKNF